MKKVKILPSILMLVTCIAILGIGVFAVAPTQNTITGTVGIDTANTPVSIELFVDDVSQGPAEIVRSGKTFNVGNLLWKASEVNAVEELPEKTITFKIQNLSSSQSLGAYFFKNGSPVEEDKLATGANIMLEDFMFVDGAEQTEANKLASVRCTPYMYIAKYDDEGTNTHYDTVEMSIRFNAYQFFDSAKTSTINYTLNIEKYEANVATSAQNNPNNLPVITAGTVSPEEWSDGEDEAYYITKEMEAVGGTTFTGSLLKFPEDIQTLPAASFAGNTNIEHIVMPTNTIKCQLVVVCNSPAEQEYGNASFILPNLKGIGWSANIDSSTETKIVFSGSTKSNNKMYLQINSDNLNCGSSGAFYPLISDSQFVQLEVTGQKIGAFAFNGSEIENLYISKDVTIAPESETSYYRPFNSCIINNIKYEKNGEGYTYKDGILTITEPLTTSNSGSWNSDNMIWIVKSLVWSDAARQGTTVIPDNAFNYFGNLKSLEIPASVKEIGYNAFVVSEIKICSGLDLDSAHTLYSSGNYAWYTNPQGTGTPVTEISAEPYTEDVTYYRVKK